MKTWLNKLGNVLNKKDSVEDNSINEVKSKRKQDISSEEDARKDITSKNYDKISWFDKLGANFRKTSQNFKKALLSKKLEKENLEQLEEALLKSDLGFELTNILLEEVKNKKIEDGNIYKTLSSFLITQLNTVNHTFSFKKGLFPQVLFIFGVNGSGKTTTIAKLANKAKKEFFKTKIVAADTFRAAAVEQLQEWGDRIGVEVATGNIKEDPASVVYKAHRMSIEEKDDLLIIDTAGRLHNKLELMEELDKIQRVIKKNDPTAPHEKVLVLDSTIGQNTYTQIEVFNKIIGVDGVVMTKLDGSSKGGSLIGIAKKYKLPIYAIGLGEKVNDLIPFNPEEYVDTLLGRNFGDKNESIH